MKAYYENKTPGYFDLKYKIYVPIDLQRYGIPASYKGQKLLYHDNRLVNHIFETIDQREAKKDPLEESIDELFKDRLGLIRSKLELILLQLEQRKEINQDILCQIDEDSCRAQTLIFEMGIWLAIFFVSFLFWPLFIVTTLLFLYLLLKPSRLTCPKCGWESPIPLSIYREQRH